MSPNIVRFTEDRYQSVDGFGLAITQASCYNLLKMSKADRTRFLTELFDPIDGVGSSLIRVCIGGSDFSMSEYTWCDSEGISHFAIHESEFTYLFPILDEIYAINPNVKIIGSPWSVPIWMKMAVSGNGAHNAWTSGRLNPKYYKDYATYFVKWIQAMEARGYKVMAVTLQNEPLNHGNSMSTYMPWTDQRDFLVQGIGPAFKAAGLSTKVLLFDHNYNYDNQGDQNNYPINILNDKDANAFAAGSAWHNYGGSVTVLDGVHTYGCYGTHISCSSLGQFICIEINSIRICDPMDVSVGNAIKQNVVVYIPGVVVSHDSVHLVQFVVHGASGLYARHLGIEDAHGQHDRNSGC